MFIANITRVRRRLTASGPDSFADRSAHSTGALYWAGNGRHFVFNTHFFLINRPTGTVTDALQRFIDLIEDRWVIDCRRRLVGLLIGDFLHRAS
jgi:hypothetical protein